MSLDHAELELEPLHRLGRRRVAVARAQPLGGEPPEQRARLLAVRRREVRQQQLAELDLDVAALGDLERGRAPASGHSANDSAISSGLFRIELVGVEAQLRLLDRRLRLHAEQRRVV